MGLAESVNHDVSGVPNLARDSRFLLMNFRKRCFSLLFILIAFPAAVLLAQTTSSAADKLYEEGKFDKAARAYEKMLEKGEPFNSERLADSYRQTGETQKAEIWYKKAIDKGSEDPEVHLNYAKMLQANGKYQDAIDQYLLYGKLSAPPAPPAKTETVVSKEEPKATTTIATVTETGIPGDTPPPSDGNGKDLRFISSDEGKTPQQDRGTIILPKFQVSTLAGINSGMREYITTISGSEVLFSSREDKSTPNAKKKKKKKVITQDLNMYSATRNGDGTLANITRIKGKANSNLDDYWAIYAQGREVVYFTRSRNTDPGGNETEGADIFTAQVKNGKWKKVRPLAFTAEFAAKRGAGFNAYPALHPQGNLLVFASNRPGGLGGTDLWITRKEGDVWGTPVNLGPGINTKGNESYPLFNNQGVLFFSSDGHPGFGGLDVFSIQWKGNKWEDLTNLGYGLNSSDDDFGLLWEPGRSSGYLASDRAGGSAADIYRFIRNMEMDGRITEQGTGRPVVDAHLTLMDTKGGKKDAWTDENGFYTVYVDANMNYRATIQAMGYKDRSLDVTTQGVMQGEDISRDFSMEISRLFQLSGTVLDYDSDARLSGVNVEVYNDGALEDKVIPAAEDGSYTLGIVNNDQFDVVFRRDAYVPTVLHLNLDDFNATRKDTLVLPLHKGDYALVTGKVMENDDKRGAIEDVILHVIDNRSQIVVDSGFTSKYGIFRFALPWDSLADYSIIASRQGYLSSSMRLNQRYDKDVNVEMLMDNADFGLSQVLKVIYYGYNQTLLDLLSKQDLNEIFYFLMANPNAKLEVRSHTDSRGTKNYNRTLSFKRSEAVIAFIRSRRELPKDRFISRGFGEEMLINDCDDENICGEEDHQKNRRTEIFILDH